MTTSSSSRGWAHTYRHVYLYLLLLIPAIILGFWKSYLRLIGNMPEYMSPVVHIHGILMFLWLLMLIFQAWLIRQGHFRVHRVIGQSSYALAPLIIIFGFVALHHEFNRTLDYARIDVGAFGMILAFGLTWTLAIVHRKTPRIHMRYMTSTAFAFGMAMIFRMCYSWLPWCNSDDKSMSVTYFALIPPLLLLITRDWRIGIRRSPYWVVTIVLAITFLAYWIITKADWWLTFCRWIGTA